MPETGAKGAAVSTKYLRAAIEAGVGQNLGPKRGNGHTWTVAASFSGAVFEKGLGPRGLIK